VKSRLTPEAELDLIEESEEIIIYAIYHSARDPEAWKRRKND